MLSIVLTKNVRPRRRYLFSYMYSFAAFLRGMCPLCGNVSDNVLRV